MPRKKPTGTEGEKSPEPRQRTTIVMPKSLYRALKIYAVNHDQDMSDVVLEALAKLGIKGD